MKYLEARKLAKERAEEREAKKAPPPANKMQAAPANKAVVVETVTTDGPTWTMGISPEQYIAMNENSENPTVLERVALARLVIEARG